MKITNSLTPYVKPKYGFFYYATSVVSLMKVFGAFGGLFFIVTTASSHRGLFEIMVGLFLVCLVVLDLSQRYVNKYREKRHNAIVEEYQEAMKAFDIDNMR